MQWDWDRHNRAPGMMKLCRRIASRAAPIALHWQLMLCRRKRATRHFTAFGGFHKWGIPYSWLVLTDMDDWGGPLFQETSI